MTRTPSFRLLSLTSLSLGVFGALLLARHDAHATPPVSAHAGTPLGVGVGHGQPSKTPAIAADISYDSLIPHDLVEFCSPQIQAGQLDPSNAKAFCDSTPAPADASYLCWSKLQINCHAISRFAACDGPSPDPTCEGTSGSGLRPGTLSTWTAPVEAVKYGATLVKARSRTYAFDGLGADAASGTYFAQVRRAVVPKLPGNSAPNLFTGLTADPASSLTSRHAALLSGTIGSCEEYVFRKYHPYSGAIEDALVRNPTTSADKLLGPTSASNAEQLYTGRIGAFSFPPAYPGSDVEFKPFPKQFDETYVRSLGSVGVPSAHVCGTALDGFLSDHASNHYTFDDVALQFLPQLPDCWDSPHRAYPMYNTPAFGYGTDREAYMLDTAIGSDMLYRIRSRGKLSRNVFFQNAPSFLETKNPQLYKRWRQRATGFFYQVHGPYIHVTNDPAEATPGLPLYFLPDSVKVQGVPDDENVFADVDDGRDYERHLAAYHDLQQFSPDVTDVEWVDIESRERNYVGLIVRRQELLDRIECLQSDRGKILTTGECIIPAFTAAPTGKTPIDRYVSPEDLVSSRVDIVMRDAEAPTGSTTHPTISIIDPGAFETVAPGALRPLFRREVAVLPAVGQQGGARVNLAQRSASFLQHVAFESGGTITPLYKVTTGATKSPPHAGNVVATLRQQLVNTARAELEQVEDDATSALQYEFAQGDKGCLFRPDQGSPLGGLASDDGMPTGIRGAGTKGAPGGLVKAHASGSGSGRRTNANLCDWNPRGYVRDFVRGLRAEMEEDYRECKQFVPGTFDDLKKHDKNDNSSPVMPADWRNVDYRESLSRVSDYLQMVRDKELRKKLENDKLAKWVASQHVSDVPRVSPGVIGETFSSSESIGDKSLFSLDYSYETSWNATPTATPLNTNGDIRPVIHALSVSSKSAASASASVLSHSFDLFDVSYTATSTQQLDGSVSSSTTGSYSVLGDTQGSFDTAPTTNATYVVNATQAPKHLSGIDAHHTFPILGIPVTLSAYLAGEMGVRNASLTGTAASFSGINGRIEHFDSTSGQEPYFQVTGGGSAVVEAVFVKVGLRVDLVLLDLGLPMGFKASISPSSVQDNAVSSQAFSTLTIDTNSSVDFSALSGRVAVMAEIDYGVGSYEADFDLFRWEGLRSSATLSKKSKSYNTLALGWYMYGLICDANGATCKAK